MNHPIKRSYKHLFFDLDETLWDFGRNSELAWRKVHDLYQLGPLGAPDFNAFFRAYNIHNERIWEQFRDGLIKREEMRWKRVWLTFLDFKIYDLDLAKAVSIVYLEILPIQNALVPFAKELLNHCKDRYALHLITNGFETTQWQKLQHSGIAGYFREVITSEKSNSMKPHREIFDYALQTTGAQAGECLMIGDALDVDVLGAYNAGWDQVYYNPQRTAHDRRPTYEIADLEELTRIL